MNKNYEDAKKNGYTGSESMFLDDINDYERIKKSANFINENYKVSDNFKQSTIHIVRHTLILLKLELDLCENDSLFKIYDDLYNYAVNYSLDIDYNYHQVFILDYKCKASERSAKHANNNAGRG